MQTHIQNESIPQEAELRRFQFNWNSSSPAEARRLGEQFAKLKDDGVSIQYLDGEEGRAIAIFNARLKPVFIDLSNHGTALYGGQEFDAPNGEATPQIQTLAEELLALMERLEAEEGTPQAVHAELMEPPTPAPLEGTPQAEKMDAPQKTLLTMNVEEKAGFLDDLASKGLHLLPLGDGGAEDAKFPRAAFWKDNGLIERPDGQKVPRIRWKEKYGAGAEVPDYEGFIALTKKMPKANWGVVCGQCSGVFVFDADGPAVIKDYEEGKVFQPLSPVYVITGNGRHYYYRWTEEAEGEKLRWNAVLTAMDRYYTAQGKPPKWWHADLRCDGGYVVAPLSVHPSGRVYSASHGNIYKDFIDRLDDLPAIERFVLPLNTPFQNAPACQLQAPKKGGGNLSNLDFSNVGRLDGDRVSEGNRNTTMTEYVGRLIAEGMTNAEDLLKECLAHSSELFDPPLPDSEVRSVLKSILAKDRRCHPERHAADNLPTEERKAISEAAVASARAKTDKIQKELEAEYARSDMTGLKLANCEDVYTDVWTENPELINVGGMLGRVTDYIYGAAFSTSRTFCFAGALALMGTALAHVVRSETGLYTNLYAVAVGLAGAGKEAPISGAKRILAAAGLAAKLLGASSPASGQAVLRDLIRAPRQLMSLDELGFLLGTSKSKNSALASFPQTLLTLFSEVDTPILKTFADGDSNYTVYWHGMSLIGATTCDTFWKNLNEQDFASGFLPRFLVFEQRAGVYEVNRQPQREVPYDIVLWFQNAWDLYLRLIPEKEEDDKKLDRPDNPMPTAKVIRKTEAARALSEAKGIEFKTEHQFRRGAPVAEAHMYGRVLELAEKLALIHHCAVKYPIADALEQPLDVDSLEWGLRIAELNAASLCGSAERHVADSEWEADAKKILLAIAQYVAGKGKAKGHVGANRSVIMRAVRNLSPRELDDHIQALIDADRLREVSAPTGARGGRPTKLYAIVEDESEDSQKESPTL